MHDRGHLKLRSLTTHAILRNDAIYVQSFRGGLHVEDVTTVYLETLAVSRSVGQVMNFAYHNAIG